MGEDETQREGSECPCRHGIDSGMLKGFATALPISSITLLSMRLRSKSTDGVMYAGSSGKNSFPVLVCLSFGPYGLECVYGSE